ncbi:hypothetical protein ACF0H5_007682 [Mactra antiquata]
MTQATRNYFDNKNSLVFGLKMKFCRVVRLQRSVGILAFFLCTIVLITLMSRESVIFNSIPHLSSVFISRSSHVSTQNGNTINLLSVDSLIEVTRNRSSKFTVDNQERNTLYNYTLTTSYVARTTKPYDVVINSYMRCGSSFTGQLLGFHPDVFYWYEPLWNYNSGVYYWGNNSICSRKMHIDVPNCRTVPPSQTQGIGKMHQVLKMIYTCTFDNLIPAVAEQMTPSYSGDVWSPYLQCRSAGHAGSICLKEMEQICRNSKHRVTKIVRLTVDNLEYILENFPNLKVIHLFRDPRAIINSRTTTKWYQLKESLSDNHRGIRLDADELCKRIMYDITSSINLKNKYPDRFAVIMYEDLQNNLERKAEILYNYLGLNVTSLKVKLETMAEISPEEHTEKIVRGSHSDWWRYRLSFSAVKAVDDICVKVYQSLGYTVYDDEDQLKNSNISAFNFQSQLLIENIYKTLKYDFNISQ